MQSRLIGTDNGLNMIAQASNSVSETTAKAGAIAADSTSNFLTQSQQRAKQVLDLQTQMYAVEGSKQSNNGLASAVDSVGKLLIQREQEAAKAKALKEQQVNVLKGTRLKAAIETNQQQKKAEAALTKEQLEEKQLLLRGDVEARLTTLYQSESGVESYRSSASKIISVAIDQGLSPKDTVELMRTVNDNATKRYDSRGERILEEQQKLQDARTDQTIAVLQVKLAPTLATIANLPPTEQSKPYIDAIDATLKETLSDQSLTETQRFRISTQILNSVAKSYGTKSEAYAKLNSSLDNMSNYMSYMNQARVEFEGNGDLKAYTEKLEYAKQRYGDYSGGQLKPGDAEKFRADVAGNIESYQKIQDAGRERLGINLDISQEETQMLAKRMLTNPAYLLQMESSPELGSNRSVKAAVQLAKDYEKYQKDLADHEDWRAANGVKFANLNMQVAGNRAQFIEQMARIRAAQVSGKKLSPAQEAEAKFTQDALAKMPELQFLVDEMANKLNGGAKNVDPAELKRAADLNEQGLLGVIEATKAEEKQRLASIRSRYGALEQYGMLKPRNVITKEAESERKALDTKMQSYSDLVRQQQTQQMQPAQYGQQSPFDGASTYGADVDARGLVRMAPRQRLNTIEINGSKVVTPVLAGSGAPLTSQWRASRDGGKRRHAGIDFGQNQGQQSVAMVSGTAYVDSDSSGYGGFIDIIGDNGYVYRYAHQGGFKFKTGQRVRAGDLISMSDGSGVGPPHLHFEVHPKANYVGGNYQPKFGESATVDPVEHLRKLSANDSSVLMPRVNNRAAARMNPRMKVPANAALLPQGAAMVGNQVQFIGGQSRQASSVYNSQRPVRTGKIPWNAGSNIRYDVDDDYGYAPLRSNTRMRRGIAMAAKELGVPGHWIADIIRQESGAAMSHKTVHNGGSNYGLFGFGNDSFSDVKVSQIKRMDETQQLQLMVRYMKTNGWTQHLAKRGGEASVAEFWAIMRMGTGWRKKALADPVGFLKQRLNDTGRTWGDEVGLLGKWAGRSYSIPGRNSDRRSRNSAVTNEQHASCQMCQQMLVSGSSILPHAHDIG